MLQAGTRLGPYEIEASIGVGGMGEVYKARDTRLSRTVAIKVLNDKFSSDSRVQARFVREARLIASLNHPHICVLYDVGQEGSVDYLVMEYLEGQTIERRLERGALPVHEALGHAIEIADALDRAHRQGMIHRDLKPGNVMLSSSGLKLLDFGLGKLIRPGDIMGPTGNSTIEAPHETEEGTILGTLEYMSPEQLEGKDAYATTDIWAFGCILFEMLTGKKAFTSNTKASLIAAIMERSPAALTSLKPALPPQLDRVVRKCLAKNPEDRWHNAHDLMDELKWIRQGPPPRAALLFEGRSIRKYVAAAGIAVAIAAMAGLSAVFLRPAAVAPKVKFSVPPPKAIFSTPPAVPEMAVSPDGTMLVFAADDGGRRLWLRKLDTLESVEVEDTDDAHNPFWSPDNRYIGFWARRKLRKVAVTGGPSQAIADTYTIVQAAWSPADFIVFHIKGPEKSGMYRVPSNGGTPSYFADTSCDGPQILPDGDSLLCVVNSEKPDEMGVWIGSLTSSRKKRLLDTAARAVYAEPGYLLTARDGKLITQRFNLRTWKLESDVYVIADGLAQNGPSASISVSTTGVLAYGVGSPASTQLVWFNREGKELGTLGGPDHFRQFRISTDGTRLVLDKIDPATGNHDIWLLDLGNQVVSRVTNDPAMDVDPVWSHDGRQIAFGSNRNKPWEIFTKTIGAGEERVVPEAGIHAKPKSWAGNGRYLIYHDDSDHASYALPLFGDRKPIVLPPGPSDSDEFVISPDSRWVAFNSAESGRTEVYIARFRSMTDKRQVSRDGGGMARWSRDGAELFYLTPDGKLMSVSLGTGSMPQPAAPRLLFDTGLHPNLGLDLYDATPDGQRFLVIRPIERISPPITVVLNWTDGIARQPR